LKLIEKEEGATDEAIKKEDGNEMKQ